MRLFGLIGYPLSHSFSKGYFSQKFDREGITESAYENFPIPEIGLLQEVIASNPDLKGLNVTIPYKEKVIPFLNEISPEAAEIGAVNTIRIERSVSGVFLKGFNTDVYGFAESLKPLLKPWHTSALILGTGGASKAVKYALTKLSIGYKVVSRTKSENTLDYHQLDENIMLNNKLIINTTPLGTYPGVEEYPPVPYQFITPQHLLYDLVYNPETTTFLKKGAEKNCDIKNGLEMLHLQAEKAWQIWNNNE